MQDYDGYDDDYNTGDYDGAGQPPVGSGSTGGAGPAGEPGTGEGQPIDDYNYDDEYEVGPEVPPSEDGGASRPGVPPAEVQPPTVAPPKTPAESKPRKPSPGEEQPARGNDAHVGQVDEGRPRSPLSKSPAFHLPGGAGSLLSHPALIVGLFGVAVILLLFAILLGMFIIYKIKRGHDEGIYYVDGDSKHLSDSANAPLNGVATVKSPLLPPGAFGPSSSPTAGAAASKTNPYMPNNGFATNNMNAAALQPLLGGSAAYSPAPQSREYFA